MNHKRFRRASVLGFLMLLATFATGACEKPHTPFFPSDTAAYEVTVTAAQPSFLRDQSTENLWLGSTRADFQGNVSRTLTTDFGSTEDNGMKFALTVEPAAAHYTKRHEDGDWEDAHGSGTHHIRLSLTETASGHHPHGEEAIPTHVHDGAIYPTGTTTGALVEEIEFEPAMTTHGYRYVANLALGALLTDGATYDIVAKIKEPGFHRDHETGEIWKGDVSVTFTGAWSAAAGFTLTTSSVTTSEFVASLSTSTTPKALIGTSNNGIPTGADTALTVKLIVDSATTHMDEHAYEAKGRLFNVPVTAKIKDPASGLEQTVTLEAFWSEHRGFYYGANVTLPMTSGAMTTTTGGSDGGGHSH